MCGLRPQARFGGQPPLAAALRPEVTKKGSLRHSNQGFSELLEVLKIPLSLSKNTFPTS